MEQPGGDGQAVSERSTSLRPGWWHIRRDEGAGLKDTSSRPAKDLGGTLRHTIRTMLRSYDSRASGDLLCSHRQGGVANMTSNPNRITVAAPGFYPKISFRLVRLFKY